MKLADVNRVILTGRFRWSREVDDTGESEAWVNGIQVTLSPMLTQCLIDGNQSARNVFALGEFRSRAVLVETGVWIQAFVYVTMMWQTTWRPMRVWADRRVRRRMKRAELQQRRRNLEEAARGVPGWDC